MANSGSGEGKVGAVYTIGHSTRSLDEFVALLGLGCVTRVIDIRTVPRSRTNPLYNEDSLPAALAPSGIAYERIAELGGLRKATASVAPEVNGFWSNRSFHNYADYALTEPFRAGLDRLLQRASAESCAIMCAEAVWWRCHRRIVSDYLIAAGREVFHLMAPGRAAGADKPCRRADGSGDRVSACGLSPSGGECRRLGGLEPEIDGVGELA